MAYYVAEPYVPKRSVCPAVAGQRAVCQPADGCSRWPLPVAAPGGRACFSARFGRRLLPSCIPGAMWPAGGRFRWPFPVAAPGSSPRAVHPRHPRCSSADLSAGFGDAALSLGRNWTSLFLRTVRPPSCIPKPRPGGRMFVNFGSLNGPHCHYETSLWQRSPFRNRVCLMLVWSPKLSREGRGHGAPLPPVRLRPEQWQAERASRGWHGAGSRVFVP